MVAVALPLASSALGSTAGASILPSLLGSAGATAGASGLGSSFLSKLGGGGLGGFFSGFGNSITGLPVMQAFGQDPSPMGSFGQLLGGGLLGGDFSNAGQAYMLGGGMNPQMSPVGMSPYQQMDNYIGNTNMSNPVIREGEAMKMLEEMKRQQQAVGQNMMMPLDTMTDPRVLMGGLLGDLSPSMRNRQIGI
tara:strand:+ start:43 stop:618 length:576 start_codon:yes stop_codon:yes gene_type:complete